MPEVWTSNKQPYDYYSVLQHTKTSFATAGADSHVKVTKHNFSSRSAVFNLKNNYTPTTKNCQDDDKYCTSIIECFVFEFCL